MSFGDDGGGTDVITSATTGDITGDRNGLNRNTDAGSTIDACVYANGSDVNRRPHARGNCWPASATIWHVSAGAIPAREAITPASPTRGGIPRFCVSFLVS